MQIDPFRPGLPTDLARLARFVRDEIDSDELEGYVTGRTAIRDHMIDRFRCSAVDAEQVIDRMEQRGFLTYQEPASPGEPPGRWSAHDMPDIGESMHPRGVR